MRKSEQIQLVSPMVDIKSKFESRAQMLVQIEAVRNTFRLKTPILYLLKHAKSEREKDFIKSKEIENFYNEQGVQMLPPYEMCERMHLVIRSILNRGNIHQDYELKKGDVLKLGRTKLLVRDINIVYKVDQIR